MDRTPDRGGRTAAGAAVASFTACLDSCRGAVHRYAARRVGAAAADDVVAETFATVWRRWTDAPPDHDQCRAWVFGVARNKIREAQRSVLRRERLSARLTRGPREVTGDPADALAAADRVRDLLAGLPRAERDALRLTVLTGLTCAEAAEVLACSVSAVTSRVSRARTRLRLRLTSERDDEEPRPSAPTGR